MTLLEALVALVILGLASLGFLGAFQGASRATRDAEMWVQAVSHAESVMEETKLGTARAVTAPSTVDGFARSIRVEPWPGSPELELITVTIGLPGGGSFELHRLAARQ